MKKIAPGRILAGLKVVDLTQNAAGPFCTQILGDLGAEVVKVERPGGGDDSRDWRPPEVGQESATFLALNRNKSSICIDIEQPAGRTTLLRLIERADVFVHSMKPGSLEKRGLGFEDLHPLCPALIYCELSAFGQVGPLRSLPGYDPLMQAFCGLMSVTGNAGDEPVRVGVSLMDLGTGMWAAIGVLAALQARAVDGHGRRVSTSLLETGMAWMSVVLAGYFATGKVPRKLGSATAMAAPYELFAAQDGHVFIAAGNNRLFANVCHGLQLPSLLNDPRFASNPARVAHREVLHESIEARTRAMPVDQIVAALRRASAPCSELNNVAQVAEHQQVRQLGMVQPLPLANAPDHRVIALPIRLDTKRTDTWRSPPALGADTTAVLRANGFTETEITSLLASGAIA